MNRIRASKRSRYLWRWGIDLSLRGVLATGAGYFLHSIGTPSKPLVPIQSSLGSLPHAQLASFDVAELNLLCAGDLPGAEQVTWPAASETLNSWASSVRSDTERYFYKFHQNRAEYQNSEAYFRMLVLVTVLQQDLHVRYNPKQIECPDFSDSRNLFLHGLLGPERQGTCVSMPVLYVAVGRRLGYPLKLVSTKAHVFARWESADGKQRLNIEATNQGLNCFPDDCHRTWPIPVSDAEIQRGDYLKSLTPEEELAVFLSTPGHCFEANGRLAEAQLAQGQAHALAPRSSVYLAFLAAAVKKELPDWQRVQVDLGQTSKP